MIESFTSLEQVNNRQEFWQLGDGIIASGAAYIPTLDLQFAGATSLDSRITFTRASTATYFNSAGTLTTAAINAARLDYNPSTLAPLGLLIEEQRTNSIRNNTMVGAVAGTPGTLPTNWIGSGAPNGLTRTVVGTGTENGITYIDVRYFGTSTSSASQGQIIQFESTTATAASNGQTWTGVEYFKLVGGDFTNVTLVTNRLLYKQADGTTNNEIQNGTNLVGTLTNSALSNQRYAVTRTTSTASTAYIAHDLIISFGNGVAIDFTLRIGLPQLELGAFATSVIPTTTTALTRNADVASMTGTNFSSWYNASEGTLYAEPTVVGSRTSDFQVLRIDDGTGNNRIQTGTGASATVFNSFLITSGVSQGNNIASVSPIGTRKLAFAYGTNSSVTAASGTVGTTDTSVSVPTGINRLQIGRDDTSLYINGWIGRISYYPTRLANSTLQALTA